MSERFNPAAEWNQNIIRNLKYRFPQVLDSVSDRDILARFYEWTTEWCLSEEEDGFVDYLKTGE